ncbi:MAG TPA: glycosyltransferase [Nitrospirae bacterium]|nr:UDP-Glc:alpha-D-GlcNAc-diphosphoundecaprenol beta-1,3-glucosyltransferase WfaP [bacterium BMS3Bbin08]HDO25767.1 glycosyltransferase [Nitrospirota bacterium]
MPKVSVIIPTYNRAVQAAKAIRSVLDQTYRDLEVIVVDDCSSDDTEEAVKRLNDNRIVYIRHDINKGGAAARNTGIRLAKGEFIAFQDSDDEWMPEKLEKQMQVFENSPPDTGVVYTGFWRVENSKRTYIPYPWVTRKEGAIHEELLKGNFITTQAALVKKECFDKAGMFDDSLPRLQDWELWLRISKYYGFKCVDEPLLVVYYSGGSITSDKQALIKAAGIISAKVYNDIKEDKKLLSRFYSYIGITLCSNNAVKNGRPYLLKAVKADPFNAMALFVTFVSLFGQSAYDITANAYKKMRFSGQQ